LQTLREIDFQFANANPFEGEMKQMGLTFDVSTLLCHLIELFAWVQKFSYVKRFTVCHFELNLRFFQ
jgi:hypothetical protein